MPHNLDSSTQKVILSVSSFTTIVIVSFALRAQLVMIPNLKRRLSASSTINTLSTTSLFLGCVASVALMAVATILLTLPLIAVQHEVAQEQELSSSINFCEEDFQHSSYIAEPANVTSSLACYVPLALLGLFGPPSKYSTMRFAATYVTLLAIGVGSMLLHALLTAEAQGGDELPMLWYTASTAYCAIDVILHHTIIVSILYIALKLDWEGTQGIEFKINVLFPLALSAGWFTILAIWTWVSEMLFCHAVMKERIWGEMIAPFIWNRVVHPLWHFFSGMLAWLLIQLLLSAHGMQQQWGIPTLRWFGAPYVVFKPHSKNPSAACSIR